MHAMATHNQRTSQTWHMQFASTARCVSLVRTQVERVLREWGYASSGIDTAVLVASELATNAVVHGHLPGHLFEVGVVSADDICLIVVSDSSPRPPQALEAGADDESGRGLQLVRAVALRTGQRPHRPLGKTVWATVHMAKQQSRTASSASLHATGRGAEAGEGRVS
ncbi:ATP-binding protein [Streptomyces smyrnaeus]|nr:ATP-binding protein [Streptomyces smyrnaeus]